MGTDTFGYFIGINFGKHKLTKISPKKSIEGSIGGIIGAIIITLSYTVIINKYTNIDISYINICILAPILSILSQFGDLVASSIKRYVDIKDFGNLIPGHRWNFR
jgi:phosphatidate cytidylyltransferase